MRFKSAALLFVMLLPLAAATLPETKPEDVGLSRERLQRIHDTIQRHIDSHDISGAVTLVMRKGRLAHLEAHGLMDVEAKKPMAKNSIFRIWSMSKPVAGVAILMLMEEGKVRLNDPVSRFLPEFKGMKVATITNPQASAQDTVEFTTDPAKREITIQDLLTHVSGLGSGRAGTQEIQKLSGSNRPGKTLTEYIPLWA